MLISILRRLLAGALFLMVPLWAGAADLTQPVVLVASKDLGQFYARTVLFAVPIEHGYYVGLILNRPIPVTMDQFFPTFEPGKGIPMNLGGMDNTNAINALARVPVDRSTKGNFAITEKTTFVLDAKSIDKVIIESKANGRFFVGMITWQPGELEYELKQGYWVKPLPATDELLWADPEGMWERLSGPRT